MVFHEYEILNALIDNFIPTAVFFTVFRYLSLYAYKYIFRIYIKPNILLLDMVTVSAAFFRLFFTEFLRKEFSIDLYFLEYNLALPIYNGISELILFYCNVCKNSLRYISTGNYLLVILSFWQIISLIIFFKLIFKDLAYYKVIFFVFFSILAYIMALTVLISLHIFIAVFYS